MSLTTSALVDPRPSNSPQGRAPYLGIWRLDFFLFEHMNPIYGQTASQMGDVQFSEFCHRSRIQGFNKCLVMAMWEPFTVTRCFKCY